jgi:hypothetical protein
MKLIQLHNNAWIDATEVDSILPVSNINSISSAYAKIQMKSGNIVLLYPRDTAVSWSDRRDRTPTVIKEIQEIVKQISNVTH